MSLSNERLIGLLPFLIFFLTSPSNETHLLHFQDKKKIFFFWEKLFAVRNLD